jgi:hypothetical protein
MKQTKRTTVLTVGAESPICQMKRDGKAVLKLDVALPVGSIYTNTTRRSTPILLLMQGCTRSGLARATLMYVGIQHAKSQELLQIRAPFVSGVSICDAQVFTCI